MGRDWVRFPWNNTLVGTYEKILQVFFGSHSDKWARVFGRQRARARRHVRYAFMRASVRWPAINRALGFQEFENVPGSTVRNIRAPSSKTAGLQAPWRKFQGSPPPLPLGTLPATQRLTSGCFCVFLGANCVPFQPVLQI